MRRGHIPVRTCVGCRRRRPKPEMIRLTAQGVELDGRAHPGRGLYLCLDPACVQKGLGRPDVRKRLGASCVEETMKLLATVENTENHVDAPHTGRVINDKCHGGGSFG
jgi:predicted RNA-binding protein YlxR (DUF448 family)